MKTYGVIGHPIAHSFSPTYFANKFDAEGIKNCEYLAWEIPQIDQLPDWLTSVPTLCGFNVTIPHKQTILPYLNEIAPLAQQAGAVNVVKVERNRNGQPILKGFNTDIWGFKTLLNSLLQNHHHKALVLGSGGASKAVTVALDSLNIAYRVVSRNPNDHQLAYTDIDKTCVADHQLIINTTPLGMHPHENLAPAIAYDAMSKDHLAVDLIYEPAETTFMKQAAERGATVANGLVMLKAQAEKSWEIWQS